MKPSTWVGRHSPTRGSCRRVLEAIAARVTGGDWCPIGFEEIVREAGVSLSTVKRCVRELESRQHLDVEHRRGRGNPNLYRVVTARRRVGRRRPEEDAGGLGTAALPGDVASEGTHELAVAR